MIFEVLYNTEAAANKIIAPMKKRPKLKPNRRLAAIIPKATNPPIIRKRPINEKLILVEKAVNVNPPTSAAVTSTACDKMPSY